MSWENNLMFLPSWCKLLSLQVWSCCSLWNLQKSKSYCSLSSFHSSPSAPSATGKNCWTLPASHPPGLSVEGTDGPMMLPRRPFHSALLCSPSTRTPQATWLHGVKHLAFSPAKRHCFKTQCSLWKIAIRDFICIHIYIYMYELRLSPFSNMRHPPPCHFPRSLQGRGEALGPRELLGKSDRIWWSKHGIATLVSFLVSMIDTTELPSQLSPIPHVIHKIKICQNPKVGPPRCLPFC